MKVSEQVAKILDAPGIDRAEQVRLILQLIETLVDDAYIAGHRGKGSPQID